MLKEKLEADLKTAMLAKDRIRTRTIRSIRAALLEKEIELREGGVAQLSDEVIEAVIQKQAKQRRDSISQFEAANREDLAETEREELRVLEEFLPEQLTAEDLRNEILAVIKETQATSIKDMGRVMGKAMTRLKGRTDGRVVQGLVKDLLSS